MVTFLDCVSKVDGSMLGKSFSATGSRNSMKGTIMNTRKGRSLKTSAQVLRNWGEKTQFKSRVVCLGWLLFGQASSRGQQLPGHPLSPWSQSLSSITLLTEPTVSTLHREPIHLHGNRKHPVHRRVIPYTHSTEASYSYILQKHSIATFYSAV